MGKKQFLVMPLFILSLGCSPAEDNNLSSVEDLDEGGLVREAMDNLPTWGGKVLTGRTIRTTEELTVYISGMVSKKTVNAFTPITAYGVWYKKLGNRWVGMVRTAKWSIRLINVLDVELDGLAFPWLPKTCPSFDPTTSPCGGDLAGTWRYQSCVVEPQPTPFVPTCPEATATMKEFFSGTLDFGAPPAAIAGKTGTLAVDPVMTKTHNASLEVVLRFPVSCLPPDQALSADAKCKSVGAKVSTEEGVVEPTCSLVQEPGFCICTTKVVSINKSWTGTYKVNPQEGSVELNNPASEGPEKNLYCLKKDEGVLWTPSGQDLFDDTHVCTTDNDCQVTYGLPTDFKCIVAAPDGTSYCIKRVTSYSPLLMLR